MGDDMTTTEYLRKLLDERGVEWEALPDQQEGEFTITATRWHDRDGGLLTMCIDDETGNTWDFFWLPTIEQAVDATLGTTDELDEKTMTVLHGRLNAAMLALERANEDAEARINAVSDAHEVLSAAEEMRRGTCRNVYEKGHFKCSECGHYTQTRMVYRDGEPADPRYCPNCGRVVKQ